ncbi:MAG TPA: hypothetical protein VMZ91_10280 [Candidatus Paceibacterota bacterium]|nr:hypothetical protein [Candidatus Paceibacterota bacterium]
MECEFRHKLENYSYAIKVHYVDSIKTRKITGQPCEYCGAFSSKSLKKTCEKLYIKALKKDGKTVSGYSLIQRNNRLELGNIDTPRDFYAFKMFNKKLTLELEGFIHDKYGKKLPYNKTKTLPVYMGVLKNGNQIRYFVTNNILKEINKRGF